MVLYREAVTLQSEGSPALRRTLENRTPHPHYAAGVTHSPPPRPRAPSRTCQTPLGFGNRSSVSHGALRDPGLRSETPAAYKSRPQPRSGGMSLDLNAVPFHSEGSPGCHWLRQCSSCLAYPVKTQTPASAPLRTATQIFRTEIRGTRCKLVPSRSDWTPHSGLAPHPRSSAGNAGPITTRTQHWQSQWHPATYREDYRPRLNFGLELPTQL